MGSHWRHLANTIEPSMVGGSAKRLTDCGAVWGVDFGGPKEPCVIDWVQIAPHQGAFLGERTCPVMPDDILP